MHLDSVLASVQGLLRRIRRSSRETVADPTGRVFIEALPLRRSEAEVRPLPISMDAPRTLALRRIHIVNHGMGTVLHDWEVWISAPGRRRPSRARVISHPEWISMGAVGGEEVPVLCRGDLLHAPKGLRVRRDVPFLVEGMLPDEVVSGSVDVRVSFKDRFNRRWAYFQNAGAITDDRSARSGGASPSAA